MRSALTQDTRVRRARLVLWLILLGAAGLMIRSRHQELSGGSARARLEALKQQRAAELPAPQPAPEPRFLLKHREALDLTPAQASRAERLQERWERESRGLRRAASDAAGYLADRSRPGAEERSTQADRPVRLQDLRDAAQPLGVVSADLSALRRRYWEEATGLLTPEQKRRLEPLLKGVTVRDLLPEEAGEGARR